MVKKLLPFLVLLLGAILIFTTSSSIDKSTESALGVATLLGDFPVLPDEPLDYDIDFPPYISSDRKLNVNAVNSSITPDGATLGRVLFYDRKLSFLNQVPCSSCHKQEFSFADDKQFSMREDVLTLRNTINLNDITWWQPNFFGPLTLMFHWDARESELAEVIRKEIESDDQRLDYVEQKLALIPYYPPLFEKAYGDNKITEDRVTDALSQFINSMSTFDSKYDLFLSGIDGVNFTDLEKEGRQIFKSSCMAQCHAESNFNSYSPFNNGLEEDYRFDEDRGVANHTGRASDVGKFKSPSLRNVEMTAPYMHDGRFNTLEEVIDFYSEGVKDHENADFGEVGEPDDFTGYNFTEREKEAIIAFLKTLTTPELLIGEKWSDPFDDGVTAKEKQLSAAITIFPNPIAENFTINLGDLTTKQTELKMFDQAGRLVWENQTDGSSQQTFEIRGLSAGVYILQLEIEGVFASKKLLIR